MLRPASSAFVCVLPLLALSGCAASMNGGGDRRYEDLRGLVLEQRRAIDDLRREQETVRATIDEMKYGARRPSGRPVYGPAGSAEDTTGYWQRSTGQPPDTTTETTTITTTPPPGDIASIPPPPKPPAPAASEPPKGEVPSELIGSSYDAAMKQLSAGDQDEAIQSFRNYLHENGSSAYADDAQFWIGESYFRKGQYHRAIIEFNQVSINYGSGDKAPAALLRQAEAFRIVGDRVDARLSLQKVINRYPGTGEAAKASRMLSEIGG
jgi:tol-pal system protein YbgF